MSDYDKPGSGHKGNKDKPKPQQPKPAPKPTDPVRKPGYGDDKPAA